LTNLVIFREIGQELFLVVGIFLAAQVKLTKPQIMKIVAAQAVNVVLQTQGCQAKLLGVLTLS
jgi:hypothetical protein